MKQKTVHLITTTIFIVLLVLAGYWIYKEVTKPPPSEEICDLIDNDYDGEIDEGFSKTCKKDSDCGPSGPYGERFCREGNVYQEKYSNECIGTPGTCLSECRSSQTTTLIEKCRNDCIQGACT